jgi:predicted amidohydrolase YtcJ
MTTARRFAIAAACAGLIACQARTPRSEGPQPADVIVVDGRVFPADGSGKFYEAVAVRGDRIALVGSAADVNRLRGPATEVIDAHGGTVMPGFNDPHFHPFLELESGPLNLLEQTTLDSVQQTIRAYASAQSGDGWIVGQGWLYTAFPGGMPTRAQLDAVTAGHPAFLRSYDYHTAWVNSKALALAGITKATADPPFGVVVRDAAGEPTGVIKENAQGLFRAVLPPITRQQRHDALLALIPKLHEAGITSIQAADSNPDDFETYDWARSTGQLRVRVLSSVSPSPLFTAGDPITEKTVDAFDAAKKRYRADDLFRIGVVKLFADGVVEAFTAGLLAPYSTRPSTTGMLDYSKDEFDRLAALLDRRGWPMMVHAIGDAAVRETLDAFEYAASVNPTPPGGRRHRVEHIETIDPSDVPRFGGAGVIASMHPSGWTGAPLPDSLIGVWAANLGPVRAARFGSWAPVTNAGGRVIIGSDWPAADYQTIPRLYAVASRQANPDDPSAQLSMAQAIEAYTSGPAWAAFDEHVKGTLAPGLLADLVVLSSDLFAQPLPPVDNVSVAVTIFDGKVVYPRPSGATAISSHRRVGRGRP